MIKDKKLFFSGILGTLLEYFDNALYGLLSAKLVPLYFPSEDKFTSTLVAFASFALGYFIRPFGGLILGYVSDRVSRKKAFLISIYLMSGASIIIGILPTYQTFGIWAPIILLTCRLIQGFSISSEYGTSVAWVLEQTSSKYQNFIGSLFCMMTFLGAVLGALSASFFTSSFIPDWGWRIPFCLGGITGLVGFYLRKSVKEKRKFINKQSSFSLKQRINQLKNFICAVGIGASAAAPFHMTLIYIYFIYINDLGIPTSSVILINGFILFLWSMLSPLMGYLADQFGAKKLMICSSIFMGGLIFLLSSLLEKLTFQSLLWFQIIMTVIGSMFVAPTTGLLNDAFSKTTKCRAFSVAYNLGNSLFGTTAPFFILILGRHFQFFNTQGIYIFCTNIIGLLSVIFLKEIAPNKAKKSLTPTSGGDRRGRRSYSWPKCQQ